MFAATSKKSRKPAAASRPAFVEPLEGRDLYSVTPVAHALPARGVAAAVPAVQMPARGTSTSAHGTSTLAHVTAQHAAPNQRLVVIAIIAVLIGL